MAAGKWNMQKASGGVASITIADGTTNTDLVLPESGTVATTSNIVGFKNYIINGNFGIWQRGTSFSGLTNGMYSADRWVVYDSVGDISYSVIRNSGVFQGGYGATYTWNSGTGTRSITQFIENVTKFKVGTQVTVSFEAYTNSTPYTVGVALQGIKGTWAAATVENTSNITITNSKKKYNVTLTIPDWTTIGIDWAKLEDTKLACKFNIPSSTNGKNFIISNIQLEEGSIATPFEQRPYGLELSLCQRYYEVLGTGIGQAKDATSMILHFSSSPKRVPATAILFNGAPSGESPINITAVVGVSSFIMTMMNQTSTTTSGHILLIKNFSGMVAGSSASLNAGQIALSAEL